LAAAPNASPTTPARRPGSRRWTPDLRQSPADRRRGTRPQRRRRACAGPLRRRVPRCLPRRDRPASGRRCRTGDRLRQRPTAAARPRPGRDAAHRRLLRQQASSANAFCPASGRRPWSDRHLWWPRIPSPGTARVPGSA